jgi:hypothetical protein
MISDKGRVGAKNLDAHAERSDLLSYASAAVRRCRIQSLTSNSNVFDQFSFPSTKASQTLMRLLASVLIGISTFQGLQRLTGTLGVNAYIPAYPTNSSQQAVDGGLNATDVSRLDMFWYSQG